jgi:hypothetical protein
MGDAVHLDDNVDKKGNRCHATKGWILCVKWKDGSMTWEKLLLMKDGYLIETAEYAVANKLTSEAAFNWWVQKTLKTREQIISKLNMRYFRKQDKYGIQMQKTVREALQIDKDTDSTYWLEAIKKESQVRGRRPCHQVTVHTNLC